MIDALPLLLGPEGYQISRSVRLRSSASAYFNRTPASAGNRKTWTWSGWVKRGKLGATQWLFDADNGATDSTELNFVIGSGDTLSIGGSLTTWRVTTQVFRDPSAWYHIVLAVDTTQATANNRIKFYVNGYEITAFSTLNNPTQNLDLAVNQAIAHYIGIRTGLTSPLDGYLTEINFIDGQALTPSSFGETNAITGVWQPKKYGGTYGTNGFYLNFSDNSGATATTIGKDYSGNGNNWTPNNISVTAGVTYDSMLDVPTPYADGGNGRGNYATFNPNSFYAGGGTGTISDGNLKAAFTNQRGIHGSLAVSSGKWYWEVKLTSASINSTGAGIVTDSQAASNTSPYFGWVLDVQAGRNYYNNAFTTLTGGAFATGDTMGIAVDMDSGKIWYAKNGTWLGTSADPAAGTGAAQTNVSGTVTPIVFEANSGFSATWEATFGQRPFSYTPPTGFVALNTQNMPTPTISNGANYMAATTYTGTGSALTIANTVGSASFQPDLVWVKSRSTVENNFLFDSVRGSAPNYNYLSSNLTNAEATPGVSMLTAINSNGFTLGTNGGVNTNAATFVGWQWNAGGSTVTNTSGTISAQVRANATAGFSVVTFTGTAANATVGHGLGVAPSMIITKNRDSATAWWVYHTSLGNTKYIVLNTTAAEVTSSSAWNNTSPTSSVFSLGAANPSNANQDVAYCFAAVAGYSAFGSYTGNGSADGPFVFCGFRPRWIMIKRTDTAIDWEVIDTSRDVANVAVSRLFPNLSNAEATTGAGVDILSNGFKNRSINNGYNASGGTYIFAAFAENPTKFSLAR